MIGEVIKVHKPKKGRKGNVYVRVEFKLENGNWAKTDVCPGFRNYNRMWKRLIGWGDDLIGYKLDGLKLKNEFTVDADSDISIVPEKNINPIETPNPKTRLCKRP